MNPSRSLLVAALASFLAGIGLAGDVHAVGSPACDAGDIVGEDPGCLQESTLCSITQAYEIAGSNCNLCVGGRKEDDRCSDGSDCPGGSCAPSGVDCCEIDFGNRDVTVTDAGVLDLGRGRLIIRAASFTVEDGGEVVGEGKKNGSPLTNGGTVEIVTTGGVEVQGPTGSIDVSAKDQAGEIDIAAVGPVTIAGRLQARNRFHFEAASGGSIHITSGDNVVAAEGSEISARGGPRGDGGDVSITASGYVELADDVIVAGNWAGEFEVDAVGDVTMTGMADVSGLGEDGYAGSITIDSAGRVTLGELLADGVAGGDSGSISIGAGGDIVLNNVVSASASGLAGEGSDGMEFLSTDGSIELRATAMLKARGSWDGSGGEISLEAVSVRNLGSIDVSGGDGGGDITIDAEGDIEIGADLNARGRRPGSDGGLISIAAGLSGEGGDVTVTEKVDVGAGGCSPEAGCGSGGASDLSGCDVVVEETGKILAVSAYSGDNTLSARRQLVIAGEVDARTSESEDWDGTNTFIHPSRKPPQLTGSVRREYSVIECCMEPDDPTCDASCEGLCRGHCTSLCDCHDGVIDEFEKCDGPAGCGFGEVCGAPGSVEACLCIGSCGTVPGIQEGEECDGADLGGETCVSQAYPGGDEPGGGLACTESCRFDFTGCVPRCGDGFVDPTTGEACDTNVEIEKDCRDLGFFGGELLCGADCTGFDVSGCSDGQCGDGFPCSVSGCTKGPAGGPEECDDGNEEDGDPCLNDCSVARCGDGVTCSGPECTTGPEGWPEECDDGNDNENDACLSDPGNEDPERQCRAAYCGDGIVCSDAECTSGPDEGPEECDGGFCCLSTCALRSCDDRNPCTEDSCEPTKGCVNTPKAAPCDDGNACTTNDTCDAGVCVGGAPPNCDDGNLCTDDSCAPATGCVSVPVNCDDGNLCTDDSCAPAAGCGSVPVNCDDGDPCTDESCEPARGCVSTRVDCNDDDPCTTDVCDAGTGKCSNQLMAGFAGAECGLADLVESHPCGDDLVGTALERVIRKKVSKAQALIKKAQSAAKEKKRRRFVKKSRRQLDVLLKKVGKNARKGKITVSCRDTLTEMVGRMNPVLAGL